MANKELVAVGYYTLEESKFLKNIKWKPGMIVPLPRSLVEKIKVEEREKQVCMSAFM